MNGLFVFVLIMGSIIAAMSWRCSEDCAKIWKIEDFQLEEFREQARGNKHRHEMDSCFYSGIAIALVAACFLALLMLKFEPPVETKPTPEVDPNAK